MKVAVIYNPTEIRDTDVINVFGMPTKERYSPKMVEMVASALERGGHNVRIIRGNKWVIDELQSFMPQVVMGERPGMVYNMAYGIQGQSRYTHLPAMLEMLGIPYVGSGPAGHAVALDKALTKIVLQRHDLPTPAFWLYSGANENVGCVRYPVIVKPRMEAVSWGLRVASTEPELLEAIESVTRDFQQQALVEEFIAGREFAVALLGNGKTLETLPIVEIDLGGDPNAIQSLDDKMQHPRGKICPAQIPPSLADDLRRLARSAFYALDLHDFARVDFRMDQEGRLYMLEVNSMASVNVTGSFVRAARAAGVGFDALINRMLEVAAIRYFGASRAQALEPAAREARNAQMLPARVRSYLRAHSSDLVESIEKMVSMNSHADNVEGVNALGEWVSSRFRALHFRRQVLPQTESGDILYFTNHDEEADDILLLCHLDTVYDLQNHQPLRVERGKLFGCGVGESKGGIGVILFALQALRSARVLRRVRCAVLLTSDDTAGGRCSGKIVAEKAARARCVVGAKYGDLTGGIVTSCSGMQEYQIELTSNKYVKGRVVPDVISAVSRKALALRKLGSREDGVSIAIGQMSAQTNPGRMADYASATIEARFVSKEQGERLDEIVRLIAEKDTDRALRAQVRFGSRRPTVTGTKESLDFFNRVRGLAERLGVRVEAVHRDSPAGICDVPESIPVLGGFGPTGGEVRSQNEFILRDSLIDRAALLALVIHESASR